MNLYKVKLTYKLFDIVEVKAESAEDALEKAPPLSDDADFELHYEGSKILEVEEAGESDEVDKC
jgi:hypothetical protein